LRIIADLRMINSNISQMGHIPTYLTQHEYEQIIMEDETLLKLFREIYILKKKDAIQQQVDFYSKWGYRKIGLARFKKWMMERKPEWHNKVDWNTVDGEMLDDIDNLLERDIDPSWEISDRYGKKEQNEIIVKFATNLYNERKDYDDYEGDDDRSGGFDDCNIIRHIQDGDGDRFGY